MNLKTIAITPRARTRPLKIFPLVFICLIAVGCNRQSPQTNTIPSSTPKHNYTHQLQIGSQTLNVEIASTPQQQEQGLSGRPTMMENQGMLFDFGNGSAVRPGFWMPDMNFNLDFIWIYQNRIIAITPNVPKPLSPDEPNSSLPIYYPPSQVNWVVEVNAGWAEKNNIIVGDDVKLKN